MKKITCVIPTLWLAEEIISICELLDKVSVVTEVIIIDNNSSARIIDFTKYGKPKIRKSNLICTTYGKFTVYDPGKNLFVSEPWNLGVGLSDTPIVCLLNDDTLIDPKAFNFISEYINSSIGIIGLDYNNYNYQGFNPTLIPINERTYAFGCCMFFLKKKYVNIPDSIKVFYNDDFLLHKIKGNKFVLSGIEARGRVSTSINNEYVMSITKDIKENDAKAFAEIMNKTNHL